MGQRRANHEGNIRKVEGRNLWQGRIMIDGERRTLYGSSRDEVRQQVTALQAAADMGNLPKQMRITVQEWLNIWLDTYCMVKESSRTKYESVMMNHIFPLIGHIALQKLTAQHVQRLYNQKFREGKSAKTIKDIHGILHKLLEKAVQLGYLQRNVCNGCDLPKTMQKEMRPIKDEEVARFLQAIQGTRYEYLFYVAVFTGMRQGELLGLTWDCINFERGLIKVYRQLQAIKRSGDEYAFSTLKSRASRIIEPAPAIIEVLKAVKVQQQRWQQECGTAWYNPDGLVFTNEIGGHLCHFTVYKHFKKIAESIGLHDVRFHDMRHTFAVLSLETGADMKTVSSTMGHATVAFTMDKYGHVSNTMRRTNAEKMQRYIESLT